MSCYCVAISSPTNVRFPDAVDADLAAYARAAGTAKSTVVVEALREWLRMQAHPVIYFVRIVTGERRATVVGGPQVWTVAEAWQQHDAAERSPSRVAHSVGLTPHQVEAALRYWADHRDEIDDILHRHADDQDSALDAWERRRALDVS